MTKIGRVAVRAQILASGGLHPVEAWIGSLDEFYVGAQLLNQLQHTCPKWAFAGLCDRGVVRGVSAGSCGEAVGKRSAQFALDALEMARRDSALVTDKRELKHRVFGRPGSDDYRRPNGEVEVLLGLWEAGSLRP